MPALLVIRDTERREVRLQIDREREREAKPPPKECRIRECREGGNERAKKKKRVQERRYRRWSSDVSVVSPTAGTSVSSRPVYPAVCRATTY